MTVYITSLLVNIPCYTYFRHFPCCMPIRFFIFLVICSGDGEILIRARKVHKEPSRWSVMGDNSVPPTKSSPICSDGWWEFPCGEYFPSERCQLTELWRVGDRVLGININTEKVVHVSDTFYTYLPGTAGVPFGHPGERHFVSVWLCADWHDRRCVLNGRALLSQNHASVAGPRRGPSSPADLPTEFAEQTWVAPRFMRSDCLRIQDTFPWRLVPELHAIGIRLYFMLQTLSEGRPLMVSGVSFHPCQVAREGRFNSCLLCCGLPLEDDEKTVNDEESDHDVTRNACFDAIKELVATTCVEVSGRVTCFPQTPVAAPMAIDGNSGPTATQSQNEATESSSSTDGAPTASPGQSIVYSMADKIKFRNRNRPRVNCCCCDINSFYDTLCIVSSDV